MESEYTSKEVAESDSLSQILKQLFSIKRGLQNI
jgi:hypothetical protein